MEFNPEDKFWHFGIELKIYEPHNKLNSTRIRWGMLIKSFEDYFILKTDVTAREDIIHENNVEEYNKFYEHIFKQLKTHFEETNINYAKKEDGNNLIYIH
ncbi:hypothetical protein GCM10025860_08320 [Methanobacterium ferruginis]|nr:hypothetical protein GCM10025860_08320 [Methanobacterium ferruginis]